MTPDRFSKLAGQFYNNESMWRAVLKDFINLQESPAGFGLTPELARAELAQVSP